MILHMPHLNAKRLIERWIICSSLRNALTKACWSRASSPRSASMATQQNETASAITRVGPVGVQCAPQPGRSRVRFTTGFQCRVTPRNRKGISVYRREYASSSQITNHSRTRTSGLRRRLYFLALHHTTSTPHMRAHPGARGGRRHSLTESGTQVHCKSAKLNANSI